VMVPGWFNETFAPARADAPPGPVALLMVDADWYHSCLDTLERFYPLVPPGGVVVMDDFGYWEGARRALVRASRPVVAKPPSARRRRGGARAAGRGAIAPWLDGSACSLLGLVSCVLVSRVLASPPSARGSRRARTCGGTASSCPSSSATAPTCSGGSRGTSTTATSYWGGSEADLEHDDAPGWRAAAVGVASRARSRTRKAVLPVCARFANNPEFECKSGHPARGAYSDTARASGAAMRRTWACVWVTRVWVVWGDTTEQQPRTCE
jgi:hypothetical protein